MTTGQPSKGESICMYYTELGVECLPSTGQALGSIPNTAKQDKQVLQKKRINLSILWASRNIFQLEFGFNKRLVI
jgi:hypothetical protein